MLLLFLLSLNYKQNLPDFRSPISKLRYKFYWHCYLYPSLKVSRQSLSRCSYDDYSNFLWGEVTWRDLVTCPCVTWVWKFAQHMRKTCLMRCAKNGGAGYLKKTEGFSTPPPSGRRLICSKYTKRTIIKIRGETIRLLVGNTRKEKAWDENGAAHHIYITQGHRVRFTSYIWKKWTVFQFLAVFNELIRNTKETIHNDWFWAFQYIYL